MKKLRCPECGFDLVSEPDVEVNGMTFKSAFTRCRFCDVLYFKYEVAMNPINRR